MIQYRPFRNDDPPALADIWQSQPPSQRLARPVSPAVLEQYVLAKPYFDRDNLIVAVRDEVPVGFAHVGFACNESQSGLSRCAGLLAMFMLRADAQDPQLAAELLARAEARLVERGAAEAFAGSPDGGNPFYVGLYAGCGLPEPLPGGDFFTAHGYVEVDRCVAHEHDLTTFRPPVNRQQLQIRRSTNMDLLEDPPPRTWWNACMASCFEEFCFELMPRGSGQPMATASFWNCEPLAATWGVRTALMRGLDVAPERRREGLGSYLLAEAMSRLRAFGFARVRKNIHQSNSAGLALMAHLGFEQVDETPVLRKPLG